MQHQDGRHAERIRRYGHGLPANADASADYRHAAAGVHSSYAGVSDPSTEATSAVWLATCELSELPTHTLSLNSRHDVLYRLLELLPTSYLSKVPREQRLPEELINLIVREARALIAAEPIVATLSSPIYICGDLHGQFYDLVNVFLRCPPLGGGVFGSRGLSASTVAPMASGSEAHGSAKGVQSRCHNSAKNGTPAAPHTPRGTAGTEQPSGPIDSARVGSPAPVSMTEGPCAGGSDTPSTSALPPTPSADSKNVAVAKTQLHSARHRGAKKHKLESRAGDGPARGSSATGGSDIESAASTRSPSVSSSASYGSSRSSSSSISSSSSSSSSSSRSGRSSTEVRDHTRHYRKRRRHSRGQRRYHRTSPRHRGDGKCGKPKKRSKKSVYSFLFLGDYVDRGTRSIEILVTLLSLKILSPRRLTMLRGNHEDEQIMFLYGFFDECKRRYGTRLFKTFSDLFRMLPVAALVNGSIFCMHGGLSMDLKRIADIPDSRPCNVPHSGVLCDLLWADPEKLPPGTLWAPSSRRISYVFSEVALQQFLEANDLDLICRAHQVVEDGYQFFPSNRKRHLLTIFTASNYCNEFGNRGAVLCIDEAGVCRLLVLEPPDFSQQRDIKVLREALPNPQQY